MASTNFATEGVPDGPDRADTHPLEPRLDVATAIQIDHVSVSQVIDALRRNDLSRLREPQRLHVMKVLKWMLEVDEQMYGHAGLLMKELADLRCGKVAADAKTAAALAVAREVGINPEYSEAVHAGLEQNRKQSSFEVFQEYRKQGISKKEALQKTADQLQIEPESVTRAIRRRRTKT